MRRLSCPRCSTIVTVAPGDTPVCPSCGFGRAAPSRPAPPTPGPPAPTAATGTPGPSRKGRTGLIVGIIVGVLLVGAVAALLIAGVFDGKNSPLSQEEAESVAVAALAGFADGVQGTGSQTVRSIEGTLAADGSGEAGFVLGDSDIAFAMVFGSNDVAHMSVRVKSGGFSVEADLYCTADAVVVVWGEMVFAQRPDASCVELDFDEEFDLTPDADDLAGFTVTPLDNGGVRMSGTEEGVTFTMIVDPNGRVTRLTIEGDGMTGTFDVTWGKRSPIQAPTGATRVPLDVEADGRRSGATYQWDVFYVESAAPLSDFEARVMQGSSTLATFSFTQAQQSSGGLTFSFQDDGDGMLNEGDGFTIEGLTGSQTVVVWDHWSDTDIEADVEIPALAPLIVLLALVVAARSTR